MKLQWLRKKIKWGSCMTIAEEMEESAVSFYKTSLFSFEEHTGRVFPSFDRIIVISARTYYHPYFDWLTRSMLLGDQIPQWNRKGFLPTTLTWCAPTSGESWRKKSNAFIFFWKVKEGNSQNDYWSDAALTFILTSLKGRQSSIRSKAEGCDTSTWSSSYSWRVGHFLL